jgi:hypothetical protein
LPLSPDDIAARLRELERTASLTHQRTEDHETDIRAFAPALVEMAEIRSDIRAIQVMMAQEHTAGLELARRIEEGKRESAANRALIRVAAIGLLGTFLTSTGAVVAALLGGGP